MKYKTTDNQSWFDLSLMFFGVADRAYELATLNDSTLYNLIPRDTEITLPEDLIQVQNFDSFDNTNNEIITTDNGQLLISNSFSFDFDLNEFI